MTRLQRLKWCTYLLDKASHYHNPENDEDMRLSAVLGELALIMTMTPQTFAHDLFSEDYWNGSNATILGIQARIVKALEAVECSDS